MHFINRHIRVLARLFITLFVVANSGFSIALTYCAMDDGQACSMACETGDVSGTCCAPNEDGSPRADRTIAFTGNGSCMLTTIVGGIQSHPTTIEKETIGRQINLVVIMMGASSVGSGSQPFDKPSNLSWSARPNFSPPSVDKHILNATFLI